MFEARLERCKQLARERGDTTRTQTGVGGMREFVPELHARQTTLKGAPDKAEVGAGEGNRTLVFSLEVTEFRNAFEGDSDILRAIEITTEFLVVRTATAASGGALVRISRGDSTSQPRPCSTFTLPMIENRPSAPSWVASRASAAASAHAIQSAKLFPYTSFSLGNDFDLIAARKS
jgi:hypothetical protein